jgi:multiple sugar transport system substrate-binding protein
MMFKKSLISTVAALGFMTAAALPAHADVSIMYAEWMSSLVEPGIANYEKETGEKVTAIKLPSDGYVERVALDLAAGTAADVIHMDSFVVSEMAGAGYLEPLGERLAGWDQYGSFMKGMLDVVSYNGQVYALPTDTDVRMLWYSKAAFEKAGIAMPWAPKTWQDVLDTAAKIKASGVENAFMLPAGTKEGEAATMQGFYMALLGADTPDDDRNRLRNRKEGKWIGDSPALRRTLELYSKVYHDSALNTKAINYEADIASTVSSLITTGKLGILASGSWEYSCFWNCEDPKLSTAERDALVAWAPWPGSGEPGTKATTNISGGWTLALNAKAKDKDKAQKLLTTIFDAKNHGEWLIKNGRMATRNDVANSDAYKANAYLAKATEMAADTTGRDTVPGYQQVSALVQQATASILDGASVDDVIKEYHDSLVDEFGEENVITYK